MHGKFIYSLQTAIQKQIDYRLAVIRKLTDSLVDTFVDNNSEVCKLSRLTGRHFLRKIPVPPEYKKGKVCSFGEREHDRNNKIPKRKRDGSELIILINTFR